MPGLSLSAGLGSLGDVIRQARKDKMQREAFEDARAEAAAKSRAETAVGNGPGPLPEGLASLAQTSPPTPDAAPGQAPIALQPSTVSAMGGLSPQAAAGLAALNGSGAAAPQGATPGQMPQPGAPPAKPPPVSGMSSVAQAGAAGMDNVVSAGLQTLDSIRQGIKAGNPGIDGRTLFLATQRQVEMLKGITPELKESMTYQLKLADQDIKQKRIDAYVANIHSEMEARLAKATTEAQRLEIMRDAVDKTYAARMAGIEEHATAAANRDQTSRYNTDARNKAMQDRANTAATAAMDREIARAKGTERNALIAARAKVASALLGSFKSDAQVGGVGDEADSIMGGGSPAGGRGAPSAGGRGAPSAGGRGAPVKVSGPDQIRKLPKGTRWVSADGSRSGVAP